MARALYDIPPRRNYDTMISETQRRIETSAPSRLVVMLIIGMCLLTGYVESHAIRISKDNADVRTGSFAPVKHEAGEVRLEEHGIVWETGDNIQLEGDSNFEITIAEKEKEKEPEMRSVLYDEFKERIHDANTYYDVIRIFYPTLLADSDIERILTQHEWSSSGSSSSKHMIPYGHHLRPQGSSGSDNKMEEKKKNSVLEGSMIMSDQPTDFHIPHTYKLIESSSKRRSRRHHRRKTPTTTPVNRSLNRRLDRHYSRNSSQRRKRHHKKANRNHPDMAKALEHFKKVSSQFGCSVPVATVIPVHTLYREAHVKYFPECTIVYQCRQDSGCCSPEEECGPNTTETISEAFFAMPSFTNANNNTFVEAPTSAAIVRYFNFTNHTSCECRPVKSKLPECLKCPKPFVLHRPNITDCKCDCLADNKACRKMKRGRKDLTEEALSCIKEGLCHGPTCQYGKFTKERLRRGSCPKDTRPNKDHRRNRRKPKKQPDIVNVRKSRDRN